MPVVVFMALAGHDVAHCHCDSSSLSAPMIDRKIEIKLLVDYVVVVCNNFFGANEKQ